MGRQLIPGKKKTVQERTNSPRIGLDTRKQKWKQKMDYAFGTWNVRSLFKGGTMKALLQQIQKYRLDILALQETK